MTGVPVWDDLTQDNRTLPAHPAPFPTRIGVSDVVAAALVPSRTGERSHIAYMVVRDGSRPVLRQFAVVLYAAGDDGVWAPGGSGTYDCSYANAMEIFREELNYRT